MRCVKISTLVRLELIAVLLAGLVAASARAQQTADASSGAPQLQGQNRDQPVHIEATTLEIQYKVKTATFSGNVQVVQGDTTMRCRNLVVFYGPEEGPGATKAAAATRTSAESQAAPGMSQGAQNIRQIEARGGVTVITEDQNASGDLGVYDLKTKTITLTGNVVISQGKNVLHGERVVVDTVAGNVRVESGATAHDRVRALILPTKDANGALTNTMSFGAPSHSN
jgi:lipopolysaccharide export system protein LptA